MPQATGEDTEQVLINVISKTTVPNSESVLFMNVQWFPSKQSSGDQPAPIIAKFVRIRDCETILNTVSKAAIVIGTKRVGVAPHLPAPMQAERKRLVPIRNKFKAEGKNARIKVSGIKVQLLLTGNPAIKGVSISYYTRHSLGSRTVPIFRTVYDSISVNMCTFSNLWNSPHPILILDSFL